MDFINPFKVIVGPIFDTYSKFVIYILLFFLRAGIILTVIFPSIDMDLSVSAAGVFIITAGLFIIVSSKDPGYTKNITNTDLSDLLDKYRSDFICMYCENRKSKDTRHCHYCRKCVKVRST